MDFTNLSNQYFVRKLDSKDVPDLLALCSKNDLYYRYCPPFVCEQSLLQDMQALPPSKTQDDKYYLGFFDENKLIAVMDLIMAYPDEHTAFIGFFMTDVSVQNAGIGSQIIEDLCRNLTEIGMKSVRLGWVQGNAQAEHFWHKNGFCETGVSYDTDAYTVTVAQRRL